MHPRTQVTTLWYAGATGRDAAPFAISDPTISREQFRLRWLADQQCYEIEPQPGAKRKIGLVHLQGTAGDDGPVRRGVTEIRESVMVPPGTCIAIEDRVLLGLAVVDKMRPLADDRLGLVGESDIMGEMPLSIQPKLLRIIQDGLVTAVGQHKSIEVDVRVIAATNRDLEEEVAQKSMRADLYHRVSGHILTVPALADRRFDVPALFLHFLVGRRAEHPALDWLWAGAKKLQNIVERSARLNLRPGPFQAPELPLGPVLEESVAGVVAVPAPAPVRAGCAASDGAVQGADERLATASKVLELAHKTVAKLLDQHALLAVFEEIYGSGAQRADELVSDDSGLAQARHRRASDRLFELLVEHQFKQRGWRRRWRSRPRRSSS